MVVDKGPNEVSKIQTREHRPESEAPWNTRQASSLIAHARLQLPRFAQSDSATERLRRGDDLAAAGAYRRCRDAGRRVAELCICGLEGALTLARVDKSTAPLDRVEQQLQRLLSEER